MNIGETRQALIRVKIEQSEVGMTVWDDDGRHIVVRSEQLAGVEPHTGAYPELVMLLHERDRIIAGLTAELAAALGDDVWEDPTGYVDFWTPSRKAHFRSTGCDGTDCKHMHQDTPAWVEENR